MFSENSRVMKLASDFPEPPNSGRRSQRAVARLLHWLRWLCDRHCLAVARVDLQRDTPVSVFVVL